MLKYACHGTSFCTLLNTFCNYRVAKLDYKATVDTAYRLNFKRMTTIKNVKKESYCLCRQV